MSTREKICFEALRLFVRDGVAGTTTRAIASACEIAEGTIYRHFTSKDELALDLFQRNWEAFATYMERAAARGTTARERLEQMVGWLVIAAERQPELFDYLFIAAPQLAAHVPAAAASPVACLKQELADMMPPAAIELHLALLLGGLVGAVKAHRAGRIQNFENLKPLLLASLQRISENRASSEPAPMSLRQS